MKSQQIGRRARGGMALAIATSLTPALADRASPALQHDLFSRPNLGASTQERTAVPVAEAWRPSLRAIVLAGERSMVLVDRSMVEIGGAVDGYRLVGVTESKATFVRGGQRVELSLGRGKDSAR